VNISQVGADRVEWRTFECYNDLKFRNRKFMSWRNEWLFSNFLTEECLLRHFIKFNFSYTAKCVIDLQPPN
jgi:hypothetical protein